MEDYFFQYCNFQDDDEVLWFDEALPPCPTPVNHRQSAFASYSRQTLEGFGSERWKNDERNDQNVHKKMMELLKKRWKSRMIIGPEEAEREKNHKHMINERIRRVKQKQSFVQLHKLLPDGTKNDKNSIVQMAAKSIEELQRKKEQLKRRKVELEMALAHNQYHHHHHHHANNDDNEQREEAKIKLRVENPSSGIDSMLEVLKCLKTTATKTNAIQSNFSSQEFSAVLQIEAKAAAAADVEKAVQKSLYEVERKFRR